LRRTAIPGLYAPMPSLARAMVSISALTGLSRVAGFVRDVLTASILGAGPVADAFFVALKLPNFFRRVTAEGAFTVAFVPMYSARLEGQGPAAADDLAARAAAGLAWAVGLFTLAAIAAMPWVIAAIAPGFAPGGERFALAVELSRVTFPYLLLMSLAALLGGALNARGRYAPFAAAPILFNLALIAALALVYAGALDNAGRALAWAVAAAGVLQLAFLAWAAWRAGVRLAPRWPRWDADTRRLLALMGPGALGAGVMQVNLFADTIIASFLGTGAISHLYYADRLEQLPLGTIGIALGTALLPMLSRAIAAGDGPRARGLFSRGMTLCLALGLPAAAGLILLAERIIGALFGYGAFTPADVATTAQVLQAYALGMPAYIAVKVYSAASWARHDTTTPVVTAIAATALNIALSLALIFALGWGVAAIALATSAAGWVHLALLAWAMRRRAEVAVDWALAWRIAVAVAVMAAALWAAAPFAPAPGDSAWSRVWPLALLVTGGAGAYAAALLALGARGAYRREG